MWLTDLAKLADPKYGLTVIFEPGWKRRGASGGAQMKAVAGVLWHHTAGSRKGNNPSRNILINGRAGLTGPLCHINMPRDGTIRITGAGKANHAGTGKVPGVVRNGGNVRLIGIEMESAGTRPWDWTAAQLAAMPRLGAALSDIFGLSTSQHWAHYEYSDGGKIDPAGLPGGMRGLRARIAAVRIGSAVVPTGGTSKPASKPVSGKVKALPVDRVFDKADTRALQKRLGVKDDGVIGPDTIRAWQKHEGTRVDGKVSGQVKAIDSAFPTIRKDCIERGGGGSSLIAEVQRNLGLKDDGYAGGDLAAAMTRAINTNPAAFA